MFGKKIKALRLEKNMTQKDLAEAIGVSTRSLINYETGRCYPRQASVVAKLSDQLGVTADYLLSDDDNPDQSDLGQKDADVLVRQLAALFAGGSLSEQDRDAAMQALQKAYWDGRNSNK